MQQKTEDSLGMHTRSHVIRHLADQAMGRNRIVVDGVRRLDFDVHPKGAFVRRPATVDVDVVVHHPVAMVNVLRCRARS